MSGSKVCDPKDGWQDFGNGVSVKFDHDSETVMVYARKMLSTMSLRHFTARMMEESKLTERRA